ncbi:MAG: hypothetical protein ACLPSF_10590 [Methylocella sp.]
MGKAVDPFDAPVHAGCAKTETNFSPASCSKPMQSNTCMNLGRINPKSSRSQDASRNRRDGGSPFADQMKAAAKRHTLAAVIDSFSTGD